MATKPQDNSPQGNAAREKIAQQQQQHRRKRRGTGEVADWANASANELHNAICAVTGAGCAIQFGYTQDAGSLVVRIVGDGEPYNEYVRPTEDIGLYLQSLIADFAKS